MKITAISLWANKLFRPEEPQPFGGAELQLVLLSRTLARRSGLIVNFITRGQGEREIFELEGIRVHKLPYRHTRFGRAVGGIYDLLHECGNIETDIFLQRAGGIETGLVAYAAKRRGRAFVFMTSHQWDVDKTREQKLGGLGGRLYRYGLNRANIIITQTKEQQSLLQENYQRESMVLRSAHAIPESVPTEKQGILWVARCEPWKRPELLLKLARTLPEMQFTMVCPKANHPSLYDEIREQSQMLTNVRFLPGVSFEEVEQLFATHRLYVNTSENEGFPNTFVQAMKWGTPIVSLYLDPDDRLDEFKTGICTYGDFDRLTRAVTILLKQDNDWRDMQRNARSYVKQNHDAERITDRLLEIFQKKVHRLKAGGD